MIHMDANHLYMLAEAANKLNDADQATEILQTHNIIPFTEKIEDICACEINDVLGQEDCLSGHSKINIAYRIETTINFIECNIVISLYTNDLYSFSDIIKLKF